jgi:hypothetical protein
VLANTTLSASATQFAVSGDLSIGYQAIATVSANSYVTGNLQTTANSTLALTVSGTTPMSVGGTASLDGTLVVLFPSV